MIICETIQEIYYQIRERAEIILSGVHLDDMWNFINYYEWSNIISEFVPGDVTTLVRYFSQSEGFRDLYIGDSELKSWEKHESYEEFLVKTMSWVLFNHFRDWIYSRAEEIREEQEEKFKAKGWVDKDEYQCQFCKNKAQ